MGVSPQSLGGPRFREAHGLTRNYVTGGMYQGIASVDLVTALGRAGMLGFFGSGGLRLDVVDDALARIRHALRDGSAFGMNLLANPAEPEVEERTVELYLRHGVRVVEASAYVEPSLPVVRYRVAGLSDGRAGRVHEANRVIAKVSRTEVAEKFLRPAPAPLVRQLVDRGLVTARQAELAERMPLAGDVCVEADSAGHTDAGNAYVLMPAMLALRDRLWREHGYAEPARIGAAGGIGTPEAALAAFMLGAEFVVTGSINQCTVEAGTSEAVKDLLAEMSVHDTEYAPAGDMFEQGARVQVVRRGVFFPARAQKLYDLYVRHDGIADLDSRTRDTLERRYFRRPIDEVWAETSDYLKAVAPHRLAGAERSEKQKMALIFRWYFVQSTRLALAGTSDRRVDYQIHCGPAMGAFNTWVRGTPLEPWRQRRVAVIAERLLDETAVLLDRRLAEYHYGVEKDGVEKDIEKDKVMIG